ncbi:MAG: hypothetical protein AAGA94_00245 [Pseudomonadota bacterium]
MTRMLARPEAPSSAIWWPLAGLVALAVIAIPATLIFKSDAATDLGEASVGVAHEPLEVSRADASLLQVPPALPRRTDAPVSHQLRQPVRLTDQSAQMHDLRLLAGRALETFSHASSQDDALARILVQTLAERQSDAYIDAALNAALARGEFAAPAALTTPFGELDTQRLLTAVLRAAQS